MNRDVDGFVLGQPHPTMQLTSAVDVDAVLKLMFTQAGQRIDVRAPRLDMDFFASQDLSELIGPLMRGDPRNKVRFLIDDADHFLRTRPRVVHIARFFSSYVKVHEPLEGYAHEPEFFVIADGIGYLHQVTRDAYPVRANPAARGYAARLERRFNEWWERSECLGGLFTTGL